MTTELAFDPAALRAKYDAERDKRLRPDGNNQFVRIEGKFAYLLDDPYTEWKEREPLREEVEVLILGGGFGGQLAAARLTEAGINDFRIVEKGGDFGGTWYWNRYPGAACDVESYVYLPLLEELGYMPTEKYARAPEIAEYARMIGRHYDLYRRALFQTQITSLDWDEEEARWRASTDRGDEIRARFIVMCSGHYQTPKLPGIPGIESFEGHSFHTSRWDYGYTGGDCSGGLDKLQDKVVGIIGTGATAIQAVPHLGQWARHLYVFQRTPSSVDIRGDRPTDEQWAKSMTPGWHQRRVENFTNLISGMPVEADLVDDSWTRTMYASIQQMTPEMTMEERGALLQTTDFRIMEGIRQRVDDIVKDKGTAEALKPWYNRLCKRPCFHDDYLETFNRPNVTLVDTAGKGVERITPKGLVVDGKEYPVDCLIYATGFELAALSGISLPIHGRGGLALAEKWKDGARTLHGIHTHDFPNLLILGTTQSAWGPNFPHMMEVQASHAAYIIRAAEDAGARTIEVTQQAEDAWVALHEQYSAFIAGIWADCTPSYFNNEGKASLAVSRNGGFGGGVPAFIDILAKWREAGALEGLRLGGSGERVAMASSSVV